MEKYISKVAVIAEIERLKERFIAFHHRDGNDWPLDNYGKMRAYNEVLSFINDLEVKEVDLDKEVDKWYNYKASKEFEDVLYEDIEKCAKHFFELGLKAAQKGE